MNEIIAEIITVIPDGYNAFAQWLACLVYISLLDKRVRGWKLAVISPLVFVGLSLFFYKTNPYFGLWMLSTFRSIVFIFLFIFGCCRISVLEACYYSVHAFMLAELVCSLEWQLYWFSWTDRIEGALSRTLVLLAVYLPCVFLFWLLEKRHLSRSDRLKIGLRELGIAALIGTGVFLMSNISFISARTPFSIQYPYELLAMRTIINTGGYILLYTHAAQCRQIQAQRELDAMQHVLDNQYIQYEQSRNRIELFNQKYHDLKHQITVLRDETDPEKRKAWLDAMEDDFKAYEAQNKTGNAVLDTVLTSKNLYCQRHTIRFTCVADGALVSFMDVRDICTIFGNALDNAIEGVETIEQKEKRLIHVSVFQQKGFVILRFENYYEGDLQFDKGLPISTKQNVDYHGYGLKSIRYTAQKYGGTVTVSVKDNWFELDIIFPIA